MILIMYNHRFNITSIIQKYQYQLGLVENLFDKQLTNPIISFRIAKKRHLKDCADLAVSVFFDSNPIDANKLTIEELVSERETCYASIYERLGKFINFPHI